MQLNPYLAFNGQCEAAFKYYQQVLGGKIEAMMTYGDSPAAEQTPPDLCNKILHARLEVGGEVLMGSDCPPNSYATPKGYSVMLAVDTPAEAERIFKALSENGQVQMPMEQTFWAVRFGMVIDQFGTSWMVNCFQAA